MLIPSYIEVGDKAVEVKGLIDTGAEAIIISASWLSRTGEGDGTLNLRGVATVLSLAGYLKSE